MSASVTQPMVSQHWDPARYAREAGFVAELGMPVVDLLAPRPGERVLDLGCGDGALTAKLAAAGLDVVGVDASPTQVEAARAKGLDARVMAGQALAFDGAFDAVMSNAAMHWMPDHPAVAAGVFRALRPRGRFACECGGFGNVASIRAVLHMVGRRHGLDPVAADPWTFRGVEEMRAILEDAGFEVKDIMLFARPTRLPGDILGWLATFAEPFLLRLAEDARADAVAEIKAALAPCLVDHTGVWWADYVRLRFLAVKP